MHCLEHPAANVREVMESDPLAYTGADDVFDTLVLCYNSLLATGDNHIANGKLLDVIRQVRTAGPMAGGGQPACSGGGSDGEQSVWRPCCPSPWPPPPPLGHR